MNIIIEQKQKGPCLMDLHIELPPEHFEKEWQRIGSNYQKLVEIPGFRKGKAPRSAVEKKYAREIKHDVIEQLKEDVIKRALEDQKLDFLGDPSIQEPQLRDDHSLHLILTLTMPPNVEVETLDYLGLEVEVEKRTYATNAMVEDCLDMMRYDFIDYTSIEDRGLIIGDFAAISYDWNTRGAEYLEVLEEKLEKNSTFDEALISDHKVWYELKKGIEESEYIPGFSAALLGMKRDEYREFEITFPNNFYEEQLRGITVFYKVELYAISIQKIPPIDDNLADKISPGSTLKALKKKFLVLTQELFDLEFEEDVIEALKKKIILNIPCEVPSSLVTTIKEHRRSDFINHCKEKDLLDEDIEIALEEFEQSAEEVATDQLRWVFIVKAIAEKESMELTQEEFLKFLVSIAEVRQKSLSELLEEVEQDTRSGDFSPLYEEAMEQKVLEFIRSKAKVNEVAVENP